MVFVNLLLEHDEKSGAAKYKLRHVSLISPEAAVRECGAASFLQGFFGGDAAALYDYNLLSYGQPASGASSP